MEQDRVLFFRFEPEGMREGEKTVEAGNCQEVDEQGFLRIDACLIIVLL